MKTFFYLFIFLFAAQAFGQTTYYVNPAAQGQNDGSSWADAFSNLHDGLSAAQAGDAVWVVQAVYRPTTGADKSARFELKSNVKMYGGFAGGETTLAERDWEAHPCILDGDIGTVGDSTDNSYNLLFLENPGEETLVDGFVFQNGMAKNLAVGTLALGTCGGAVFIDAKSSSAFPLFKNCVFRHNAARLAGGAVYAASSTNQSVAPRFSGCHFENNICNNGWGGAIYRKGNNGTEFSDDLLNCRFVQNEASSNGGAVFFSDGQRSDTIDILGCHFEKNLSKGIGGGFFTSGRPNGMLMLLRNSTFIENAARIGSGFCHYTDDNPILWVTLDSCSFDNNQFYIPFPASTYYSGALSLYSGYYSANDIAPRKIEIKNCRFIKQDYSTLDVVILQGDIIVTSNLFYNAGFRSSAFSTSLNTVTFMNNFVSNCDDNLSFGGLSTEVAVFIYHNIFFKNRSLLTIVRPAWGAMIVGNAFVDNIIENQYTNQLTSTKPLTTFKNNIFWGNRNLFQPINLSWRIPFHNDTAYFSHNLFDFTTCDSLPNRFICEDGNVFGANPQFFDLANGDFRLLPCSPATNAGDNLPYQQLGIGNDYGGMQRILDNQVDIGPFESPVLAETNPPFVHPACTDTGNASVEFFLKNGCPPFQFQWDGPNGIGSDTTQLEPGGYMFTISDSKGKTVTADVSIGVAPSPQIVGVPVAASCQTCADGAVHLDVSAGYPPFKFLWSNGSTTKDLQSLIPNTYTLTITDGAGCVYFFEFQITYGVGAAEPSLSDYASITPNPVVGLANITIPYASHSRMLTVVDVYGRVVLSQKLPAEPGSFSLDMQTISNGTYFVSIRNEGKSTNLLFFGKLVKIAR